MVFLSPFAQQVLRYMKSNSSKTVLEAKLVKTKPVWLIGDRAYDSDLLDKGLRVKGIELIASIR